ncbi:hypothetical protein CK203_065713 [Vitis vinifera]|uniref:Uncharacterized protein n=1 Tax=Vitis vinifera TaxID=29760 RepID=A0A438G2D7_VITVI|nr:hypothetical protein CK203_065713 [Vitis vinifera]
MEQNNGVENENDEKMKVAKKDERTSDHKDNDMRNVEDGDKQDAKVHEQQEEGHKVEEKSLMEERLSENDSCGDMELHVSPIVNNHCQDEKTIPMSILPNVEDSHSLSTLESLVVAYVFDVSLDKRCHANLADFLTLGPRQELLNVIINVFACKLNSFENKFKGIRPTRCYLPTTFAQSEIEESSLESISKSKIQGVWDPAHSIRTGIIAHSTRVGITSGCRHYIRLPPLHPAVAITSGCRHFPPGCSHPKICCRRHYIRMSYIRNSGAGWERRAFSTSPDIHIRIL